MNAVLTRRNLINREAEDFKPPRFKPNSSVRNRLENWLRRFLDLQAGSIWRDMRSELCQARGSLLDVGCGAQIYRDLLPAHVDYSGIDTKDAGLRFGYSMPDTHYFEADDWGVAEATFDTVLCTEVVEHIPDPVELLGRACRCLRPGGRLVLTVPFSARCHFIPYDYWRFTPHGLGRLLTAAGFENVHVRARGNPLTVACYKLMTLHFMLLLRPRQRFTDIAKFSLGLLISPILGLLACIANISLRSDWGDDCLGYTVTAYRKTRQPQPAEVFRDDSTASV